jgi:hypothetical protein
MSGFMSGNSGYPTRIGTAPSTTSAANVGNVGFFIGVETPQKIRAIDSAPVCRAVEPRALPSVGDVHFGLQLDSKEVKPSSRVVL